MATVQHSHDGNSLDLWESVNLKQHAICDHCCMKSQTGRKHVGKAGQQREIGTIFFLVSQCWFTSVLQMSISHSLLYDLNDSSSIHSRTGKAVRRGMLAPTLILCFQAELEVDVQRWQKMAETDMLVSPKKKKKNILRHKMTTLLVSKYIKCL